MRENISIKKAKPTIGMCLFTKKDSQKFRLSYRNNNNNNKSMTMYKFSKLDEYY